MNLNEDQKKAIELSNRNQLAIITGGAGTGKTTIIKNIAENFKGSVLCAPTGKAASRLREATGLDTCTLHSFMKYTGEDFMLGTMNGVKLIIDEASMIDSVLMSEIVRRRPDKLILVGDNAQLPPVGMGQPFHDLVKFRPDLTADLKICYRSSEAVFQAASEIRRGKLTQDEYKSEKEHFKIIQIAKPETLHKNILQLVKKKEFDFQKDIILVPKNGSKETPVSVKGLNHDIKRIVNPSAEKFAPGDRIICGKNFPENDVWNGSTGTVSAIEDGGRTLYVKMDLPCIDPDTGNLSDYARFDKEMQKHSTHAYALTVHKSQGSQYRNVYFACISRDAQMLYRALIYTAVTRTKSKCFVIGSKQAFRRGINHEAHRETALHYFLSEDI